MSRDKEDRELTWKEFEERLDTVFDEIKNLIEDTYGKK